MKYYHNIPHRIVKFCIEGFFPKWKSSKAWKFKMAEIYFKDSNAPSDLTNYSVGGACSSIFKLILIDPVYMFDEEKKTHTYDPTQVKVIGISFLIHEMVHAVTNVSHHPKKFFNRLRKCEIQARRLGHPELATEITKDLKLTYALYKSRKEKERA
jgi:hypothetical protein